MQAENVLDTWIRKNLLTVLSGRLIDASKTQQLAERFADVLSQMEQQNLPGWGQRGLVVYLEGNLGAGKSYFARALIQSFLPGQKVKSPTYTLVETYEGPLGQMHHFDLYRLCDPEELEFLGIRDLLKTHFVSLVEWPSKGEGVLEGADVMICLQYASEENPEAGRFFEISAVTQAGEILVKNLSESVKRSGMEIDK